MASLEGIRTKILNEANEKALIIKEEAKKEAKNIVNSKIEEAKKVSENILKKANEEALLLQDRIISNGKLTVRDEKLFAKGRVIEKVFNMAKEELKNIDEERYIKYLKNNLNNRTLNNDETLIVNSKYLESLKNEFNNINLQGEDDLDGFKIEKNGVFENYSFSKLIDFNKDSLKSEIIKVLY